MNHRQRFLNQMHYQPVDRTPLYDFSFWQETFPAWYEQGLPRTWNRRNIREYFGLDASLGGGEPDGWHGGANCELCPRFEERVIEDRGDIQVIQQSDGVQVMKQKSSVSIPMHVGHTLVDRESWKKHYLPKLDPSNPDRYAKDWERRAERWRDADRDHPVILGGGSLFGRLRDWMGLESISLVVYDDPAWFEEMVTTMGDLSVAVLEKAFATGGRFDAISMWEDMCYNAGPLLGPEHFKRYLVPHYRRISDLARKHGVDIIWVDCDGKIDDLIPHWLDAGINCMFPIEIGNWADPVDLRRRFGRDLLMMGGFDKHVLARSREDIRAEVERLLPLVEEGGFIGFCDHRVPPNVPLINYVHYMQAAREIWCKGVNLPPMPTEELLAKV